MRTTASSEVEYRSAFEEFSRMAQRVQFLAEHPTGDRKTFETALVELEKAHLAYNAARDAFVQALLPASSERSSHGQRQDRAHDVPAIAELLWESAGRPTGTAEDDWRRAEAIVQRAVSAACCSA
jgi:multidrug resistance efflux pump